MTFNLKNKKIFNCLFLALLIGCSEKNPTASVGESILVVAELPEESQDLEFLWEFIDLPSNSLLENINLRIGNDNSSVIFTPDAPGTYSLNVSIFQYNDEVSSQNFTYEILTSDSNNFSINKFEDEKFISIVDSSISDSIKAMHDNKWYETDLATKLIDEIKSQEIKTEKVSNQEINSKKTADNEPSSAKTKDIIKIKGKSTAKKSNKKKGWNVYSI